MRKLPAALLCLATVYSVGPVLAQQPATMRASVMETHDGMTIGVDPWTLPSRYKEKFSKKTPLNGGVVGIHVSFRNNTDESMRVDLKSIRLVLQLEEDNRQEISSLTAEEVADAVLLKKSPKDPTARRLPLPIPGSTPKPNRDKNWDNLKGECQNAGVPSTVVAAHSTMEGLLYFDLRGQMDLLQNAHLYVPNLSVMGTNQQLLYFEIDLGHAATD